MTAGTGRSAVRLGVDLIACDGRGLCAEALPELITLDDWGFPILDDRAVPPRLLADARETASACPKLALRLECGPPATATPGFREAIVPDLRDDRHLPDRGGL
jgi:ferredoxin